MSTILRGYVRPHEDLTQDRIEAFIGETRKVFASSCFEILLRDLLASGERDTIRNEMNRLDEAAYEDPDEKSDQNLPKDLWFVRRLFTKSFGFAAPCKEAIAQIVHLCRDSQAGGRLLEVGAGTGFWATLLDRAGLDVIASDPYEGVYGFQTTWFPIVRMDCAKAIEIYHDRDVLMSWPCRVDPWCERALDAMQKGRLLFYIGEDEGGCTASYGFFEILARDFESVETITIPNWPGIHDRLYVYRKTRAR